MTRNDASRNIVPWEEPAVWIGPLKARMRLAEFEMIVETVLRDGWLARVHEYLTREGGSSKLNRKFLQTSFEQNAFHQGRAPHLRALAIVWLLASFEEAESDLAGAVLQSWAAPMDTMEGSDASSMAAGFARAKAEIGSERLQVLMRLFAPDKRFEHFKRWQSDQSPRPTKRPSVVSRSAPSTIVARPAESSAEPLIIPSQDSSPTGPSSVEEHHEADMPLTADRVEPAPQRTQSSDADPLKAPQLLWVSLIQRLHEQAARIHATEQIATSQDAPAASLTTSELDGRARLLRDLASEYESLSVQITDFKRQATNEVSQAQNWLRDRSRSLSENAIKRLAESKTVAELTTSEGPLVDEYQAIVTLVRAEHAQLRASLDVIATDWASIPEIPEHQIQAWRDRSAQILARLDSVAAAELADAVKQFREHVLRERSRQQFNERSQRAAARIEKITDAAKRERCLRRLQTLSEDKSATDESRQNRLEELEDMLPADPDPGAGLPTVLLAITSGPVTVPPPAAHTIEKVQIQHSFFSDARTGGQKRPVLIIPPDPKPLMIPLCFEIAEPLRTSAQFEVRVSGESSPFKNLSPERRSISRSVAFPPGVTRLELSFPLPLPDSVRTRLSERKSPLQIRVTALGQSTDLSWDSLQLRSAAGELPKNPLAIGSPSRNDIQRLQVGIETRLDSILEWIRTGRGHIYIAAPRRFGKTSVVDYCEQSFDKDQEILLVRFECKPAHYAKRGQVFKQIVRALAGKLDVNEGQTCDRLDRWQDSEDDWEHLERVLIDKLRRDALQKRYRRIVVLIDEAQILFARGFIGQAYEFADRMKSFLERIAREHVGADLAPMFMGFFGRLNLRHLFGQNLRDTFLPPTSTVTELGEEEVTAVLRGINAEVDSTASARARLREYGINLVFLRDMFGAICTNMAAEHRIYVVRSDVDQAIQTLREARDIFQYLRDPLNRSDDTNVWQPVRGYPVAIAIATAANGAEYVSLRSVVEKLSGLVGGEMLNEDLLKRILNDDELNDIVERSRDLVRIKAEPLRQFLCEQRPPEEDLRRYMAELVVPSLELPPGSEIVNTGGQVELRRAVLDGAEVAIRYFLPDANPVRFQREISALKLLGQHRAPGQPGFQSLPELVKSGRAPNGRLVAIYKWVDGVSLREQLTRCQPGGVPPNFVRTVCFQVASALVVVHERQFAHRDIKPENILLSTHDVAVLIDFGLVRDVASISATNTVGTGLYVPPVGQGNASGDLYALARTVCVLMSGADSEQGVSAGLEAIQRHFGADAGQIVQRALRPDLADRGSAKDFAKAFAQGRQRHSEFGADRDRKLELFSGRGLNEQVRKSLTIATSFADGVGDANLRLVVGAALCCDLIDCLQREKARYARSIDTLLSSPGELAELGLPATAEAVRWARVTNQLRNGFGHWNSLENQISAARSTAGRPELVLLAVEKTLGAVASALYKDMGTDSQRREYIKRIGKLILVPQ